MGRPKYLCVALLALSSSFITPQLFAQEDVIKKRKAFMDSLYDKLKAIKRAVPEKDYATIELKAKEISGDMDTVLDHFPRGSTSGKSRASPEIWEKWDEFKKIPAKVKDVAGDLAKAAAAKDQAEVETQFKALGPQSPFRSGACYECHKDFRTKEKKNGG